VSNRKDNKNAVHFLVEEEKENEIDEHLINKSQKERLQTRQENLVDKHMMHKTSKNDSGC
jgi:hypothetical protein